MNKATCALGIALASVACGNVNSGTVTPTPVSGPDLPPQFRVSGPVGCNAASSLPTDVEIVVTMTDAGDAGISHFDRFVGHDATAGCAPTYNNPHPERLRPSGVLSYSKNQAGASDFWWSRLDESCGRSWVVLTANRPTSPTNVVITTFAADYGVDCG